MALGLQFSCDGVFGAGTYSQYATLEQARDAFVETREILRQLSMDPFFGYRNNGFELNESSRLNGNSCYLYEHRSNFYNVP